MFTRQIISLLLITALALPAVAQNPDLAAIGKIREEGLQRSQVMEHVSWLADVYGPRLTGSAAIKQASVWAQTQFKQWGLSNIHEEEWPFGKGWRLVRFDAHMTEPQVGPLIGYPKAWAPGTPGRINADVALAVMRSEADFDKYRGQLKGKIVLTQTARPVRMLEDRLVLKMTEADIKEAMTTPIPTARAQAEFRRMQEFNNKLRQFYLDEGVAALFERGGDGDMAAGGSDLSWQTQRTDGGTIFVQSGGSQTAADVTKNLPQVVLAVEHYNRLVRVLEKRVPVKVELNIQAEFLDEAVSKGFNLVAEIPGTDLADEVVLLGAHFDSWHSGTGATDNATGSAAMMEALRILQAAGVKPRRTIRIGLWGGEEEGLLGSRAYVKAHYADVTKMALLPEHAKLAAYFNLDNGTGRIRGIWSQGNLGAMKVFEKWFDAVRDLGATLISPRSVSQTDHISFEAAGLPGFQFMQERLEYNSRTHHSNMDVVDHVQREDMVQVATVTAVMAYQAAMANEKLPRKALPAASNRGGN